MTTTVTGGGGGGSVAPDESGGGGGGRKAQRTAFRAAKSRSIPAATTTTAELAQRPGRRRAAIVEVARACETAGDAPAISRYSGEEAAQAQAAEVAEKTTAPESRCSHGARLLLLLLLLLLRLRRRPRRRERRRTLVHVGELLGAERGPAVSLHYVVRRRRPT